MVHTRQEIECSCGALDCGDISDNNTSLSKYMVILVIA